MLCRAKHVPVGEDQTQHLELARETARAFNARAGVAFFPIPHVITTETKRVMSLKDGTVKMSKSDPADSSRINMSDSKETILGKIRRAKTDSIPEIYFDQAARPEISNLLTVSSLP